MTGFYMKYINGLKYVNVEDNYMFKVKWEITR